MVKQKCTRKKELQRGKKTEMKLSGHNSLTPSTRGAINSVRDSSDLKHFFFSHHKTSFTAPKSHKPCDNL
jgi:hypothetical protein